ncbi:hypothetical protein BH23PAT1_BH23PAT1_1980 [soil metagenome]
MAKPRLDLRKISRFQGKCGRAKTVLSDRDVSINTSKEEKRFAAGRIWTESERALRKSSKAATMILSVLSAFRA